MSVARFTRVSKEQYEKDTRDYPEKMELEAVPLPARATAGSAGYDFVCPCEVRIAPGERVLVPTGIRAEIDAGWMLMLCPRSGLGRKYGLRLSNTVGIVDSDYAFADNEGHILLALEHSSADTVTVHAGERVCQGIFLPVALAEGDSAEARRTGGYGSTGA